MKRPVAAIVALFFLAAAAQAQCPDPGPGPGDGTFAEAAAAIAEAGEANMENAMRYTLDKGAILPVGKRLANALNAEGLGQVVLTGKDEMKAQLNAAMSNVLTSASIQAAAVAGVTAAEAAMIGGDAATALYLAESALELAGMTADCLWCAEYAIEQLSEMLSAQGY